MLVGLLSSLLAADFAVRMGAHLPTGQLPANAVVFTGQFDRVRKGLELLKQGHIERLLISGVNAGAGILAHRFVGQFELDGGLQDALKTGRLTLGPRAETTIENATETWCWARSNGLTGPLLLITSRHHMPRASLLLERALPDAVIWRMSVPGETSDPSIGRVLREFAKFARTWPLGIVPRSEHGSPANRCR